MAKGQKRSNREVKKPKADKAKKPVATGPAAAAAATAARSQPEAATTGGKK